MVGAYEGWGWDCQANSFVEGRVGREGDLYQRGAGESLQRINQLLNGEYPNKCSGPIEMAQRLRANAAPLTGDPSVTPSTHIR